MKKLWKIWWIRWMRILAFLSVMIFILAHCVKQTLYVSVYVASLFFGAFLAVLALAILVNGIIETYRKKSKNTSKHIQET